MSPLFRKRREDETGSIAPKGHNSSLTRQIATFINTIDPKRSSEGIHATCLLKRGIIPSLHE
jgi:hypothetical protein